MSLGLILVIILIIFLLGGFSGRFGGYGYGYGHGGLRALGIVLIILVVLRLPGRLSADRWNIERCRLKKRIEVRLSPLGARVRPDIEGKAPPRRRRPPSRAPTERAYRRG